MKRLVQRTYLLGFTWDRLGQPPVQIEFPHLSAPSQVFHKQKLHCRQLYKSSLFARWAFDIGKKLSEPQGGDSVQAKNPPANASSAMKYSCLPQYFVQNLDNDVHVLTFNSSVPREFLMPKGTNNRGFGTGLTGSKTLWGSHSHFDKLSTNHGCGRMFGVKGFRPHPPKAQTFHPAVCTMRAAKYSAAVETCDCSVLTIHQAPPCGHSWLVAVALRDDEGWKEESQLTSSNVPRTAVWVMRIELFVFFEKSFVKSGALDFMSVLSVSLVLLLLGLLSSSSSSSSSSLSFHSSASLCFPDLLGTIFDPWHSGGWLDAARALNLYGKCQSTCPCRKMPRASMRISTDVKHLIVRRVSADLSVHVFHYEWTCSAHFNMFVNQYTRNVPLYVSICHYRRPITGLKTHVRQLARKHVSIPVS